MKLTPFQYKVLKIYRRYQANGLTVSEVLRVCWPQWVLLLTWALVAYLLVTPYYPALSWLVVGFAGGALLRDLAYYRISFRMWPINREIYDWRRVSDLIEQHEKDTGR